MSNQHNKAHAARRVGDRPTNIVVFEAMSPNGATLMAKLLVLLCASSIDALVLSSPARRARVKTLDMVLTRSEAGVFDGQPYSPTLVPESARRCALIGGGSLLLTSLTLPNAPVDWGGSGLDVGLSLPPLLTLFGMFSFTAVGWKAFGADMHPVTAKARGLEPPPAYAFTMLGLGGALLGASALAFNAHPLPVAASGVELLHCALPLALWQLDTRLLQWLNPQIEWPDDATSLPANYGVEYDNDPLAAGLALFGVLAFEVYVQQVWPSYRPLHTAP